MPGAVASDPLADARGAISHRRNARRVAGFVHDDRGVGVVEQVDEFVVCIAVVDVHGHESRLQRADEGLHVLRPVVGVERDLRVRCEAAGEMAGQGVAAAVEVAPRTRRARDAMHERLALGYEIGDLLEHIGQIPIHRFLLRPAQIAL